MWGKDTGRGELNDHVKMRTDAMGMQRMSQEVNVPHRGTKPGKIARALQVTLLATFVLFFFLDLVLYAAKGIGFLMNLWPDAQKSFCQYFNLPPPVEIPPQIWEFYVLWPPAYGWVVLLAGCLFPSIAFWGIPRWFHHSLSLLRTQAAWLKIKPKTRSFELTWRVRQWGNTAGGIAILFLGFIAFRIAFSDFSLLSLAFAVPVALAILVHRNVPWVYLVMVLVAIGMFIGTYWVLVNVDFAFPVLAVAWAVVGAIYFINYSPNRGRYKSRPLHIAPGRVKKWRRFLVGLVLFLDIFLLVLILLPAYPVGALLAGGAVLVPYRSASMRKLNPRDDKRHQMNMHARLRKWRISLLGFGLFLGIFLISLLLFPITTLGAFLASIVGIILYKPRQSWAVILHLGRFTKIVFSGIFWPAVQLYFVIAKHTRICKAFRKLVKTTIWGGSIFAIFLFVMWTTGGVFSSICGFSCLGTAIVILAAGLLMRIMPLLLKGLRFETQGVEIDENSSSDGSLCNIKYPKWVEHFRKKGCSSRKDVAHQTHKISKKTLFQTMALGFAILCLFGGEMLGSLPGWNFNGVSTSAPTGTTEWLYLTHNQIMADEETVFPFYANNYSYIVTKVSGTPFVNFTLGDNFDEPKMYIATEGWSWWSVKFEAKDWGSNPEHTDESWFNITVDENLRQYIDTLAVQPYILAKGEESIGEDEEPLEINFHGIGSISLLLWANALFSDLYVELDGTVLKPDVSDEPSWNEANWSTAVLAPWLQGGTALVFTVDCDAPDHVLKLGGWGNLTYTVCTEYDLDGDDLSDSLELQHLLDWGVLPNYPDIWGKMTSVREEVNYSVNDFLFMTDESLLESPKYKRYNLEFYIPGAYTDSPNHFFIDAYGEYTQFEIDGDAGITMENVTLYGFYSNNPEITTLTDQDGNQHTLPINQLAARDTYYAGDLNPGWHKVVFLERIMPFSSSYIKFRINDYNVIITEGNEIEDPEGDSDGDTVPNSADLSLSQFLTWEAGTITQLVIPVDPSGAQDEDSGTIIPEETGDDEWEALPAKGDHAAQEDVEVEFQVIRPSYDKSTSQPIIWHKGEEGALKCHIIPVLRLFSKGNPASTDYLYKDEGFASFWGEGGIPRKIETYNLVDVNAFGEKYNPTGDFELLPEKDLSNLCFNFVFPSIATNVWEFSIRYPHDHPNLQDGCLSIFFDFCWVAVKEDGHNGTTDILQVYDFSAPQTLNISGIQKKTFSNVNGLIGSPNDHVSLRALQLFNQNPALCLATGGGGGGGGPYPAATSSSISDAILYHFVGAHYMEAYNYDEQNADTWSVSERFARGALLSHTSHCQALYTFDSQTSSNLDYWGSGSTVSTSSFKYYVAEGALHLIDEHDSRQITLWREFNETIEEDVSVSWDFMIESSSSDYSSVWMGLANNGVDLITLRMDKNLLFFQNNYVLSGGWAVDTWHTARITFNNRTREGRLFVDGYDIGTCTLPISAGEATEFIIHTAGTSTYKLRAQIDDVNIEWNHNTYTPKWSNRNHVEFLSVSQSYMDILQKLFVGSKFDVAADEEYAQYPGTLNFNGAQDGTSLDLLGWTITSGMPGSIPAQVVRNIDTHAKVAYLQPIGVPPDNDWARASANLGRSTNVDFVEFWFAIGSPSSVFTITLDGGVSGTGIVLEYRGGNFYYKEPDNEWVKICNLWPGGWFQCRVDYNCSDGHFNIFIGGSTEGLKANCSFFSWISGISRITFNTDGGSGFFHSIGRSSDSEYSGNNLCFDTIKSGEMLERITVCKIFDMWNNTYASDSNQLHLDNEILFQVVPSNVIYEHKRASFNRYPVAIDLKYANDDFADGYSVMNRLDITYAEGDIDTHRTFPSTPGSYAAPVSYWRDLVLETSNDRVYSPATGFPPTLEISELYGDIEKYFRYHDSNQMTTWLQLFLPLVPYTVGPDEISSLSSNPSTALLSPHTAGTFPSIFGDPSSWIPLRDSGQYFGTDMIEFLHNRFDMHSKAFDYALIARDAYNKWFDTWNNKVPNTWTETHLVSLAAEMEYDPATETGVSCHLNSEINAEIYVPGKAKVKIGLFKEPLSRELVAKYWQEYETFTRNYYAICNPWDPHFDPDAKVALTLPTLPKFDLIKGQTLLVNGQPITIPASLSDLEVRNRLIDLVKIDKKCLSSLPDSCFSDVLGYDYSRVNFEETGPIIFFREKMYPKTPTTLTFYSISYGRNKFVGVNFEEFSFRHVQSEVSSLKAKFGRMDVGDVIDGITLGEGMVIMYRPDFHVICPDQLTMVVWGGRQRLSTIVDVVTWQANSVLKLLPERPELQTAFEDLIVIDHFLKELDGYQIVDMDRLYSGIEQMIKKKTGVTVDGMSLVKRVFGPDIGDKQIVGFGHINQLIISGEEKSARGNMNLARKPANYKSDTNSIDLEIARMYAAMANRGDLMPKNKRVMPNAYEMRGAPLIRKVDKDTRTSVEALRKKTNIELFDWQRRGMDQFFIDLRTATNVWARFIYYFAHAPNVNAQDVLLFISWTRNVMSWYSGANVYQSPDSYDLIPGYSQIIQAGKFKNFADYAGKLRLFKEELLGNPNVPDWAKSAGRMALGEYTEADVAVLTKYVQGWDFKDKDALENAISAKNLELKNYFSTKNDYFSPIFKGRQVSKLNIEQVGQYQKIKEWVTKHVEEETPKVKGSALDKWYLYPDNVGRAQHVDTGLDAPFDDVADWSKAGTSNWESMRAAFIARRYRYRKETAEKVTGTIFQNSENIQDLRGSELDEAQLECKVRIAELKADLSDMDKSLFKKAMKWARAANVKGPRAEMDMDIWMQIEAYAADVGKHPAEVMFELRVIADAEYKLTTTNQFRATLSTLLSEVLAIAMDFLMDLAPMFEERDYMMQAHGMSQEQAWNYAFAHYAPEWLIEAALDIAIVNMIQSAVVGSLVGSYLEIFPGAIANAKVIGFGINFLIAYAINYWVNMLWQTYYLCQKQFELDWTTDTNLLFEPQLILTTATNKSLTKHFGLRVGDTVEVKTKIDNIGILHWDYDPPSIFNWFQGGWTKRDEAELPESGAPCWFRARYALAGPHDTLTDGDYSDWVGQWNTGAANDHTPPLVGYHYMCRAGYGDLNYPFEWDTYTIAAGTALGKSAPIEATTTIHLMKAEPIVAMHTSTQIASTYGRYTCHGEPYTAINVLDDVSIVESTIDGFIAASSPIPADALGDEVDSFHQCLENNSWAQAQAMGTKVISDATSDTMGLSEALFRSIQSRVVRLSDISAPLEFFNTNTMRFQPFTFEQRQGFSLLQCTSATEYQQFLSPYYLGSHTFLDEGFTSVNPVWSKMETFEFRQDFDDQHLGETPNGWNVSPNPIGTYGEPLVNVQGGAGYSENKYVWFPNIGKYGFLMTRDFAPMPAGKAQFQVSCAWGTTETPTPLLTMGLGRWTSSGTLQELASFAICDTDEAGYSDPNWLKYGSLLSGQCIPDYNMNFRIEWDYCTNTVKIYANDWQNPDGVINKTWSCVTFYDSHGNPVPLIFLADGIPTVFFLKCSSVNYHTATFDEFSLTVYGSDYQGYWTAQEFGDTTMFPANQILIPNTWIARMSMLYDTIDGVKHAMAELPLTTDITGNIVWNATFDSNGSVVGKIDVTHSGFDDPIIKWSLDVPPGFDISPNSGIGTLQSLVDIPFILRPTGTACAGVYPLMFNIAFACNSTEIYAQTYFFRYTGDHELLVEFAPSSFTIQSDTDIPFARISNEGTLPEWVDVDVSGIPLEWLHSYGYYAGEWETVTRFDFANNLHGFTPTDTDFALWKFGVNDYGLLFQSDALAEETISVDVDAVLSLEAGDRIYVSFNNDSHLARLELNYGGLIYIVPLVESGDERVGWLEKTVILDQPLSVRSVRIVTTLSKDDCFQVRDITFERPQILPESTSIYSSTFNQVFTGSTVFQETFNNGSNSWSWIDLNSPTFSEGPASIPWMGYVAAMFMQDGSYSRQYPWQGNAWGYQDPFYVGYNHWYGGSPEFQDQTNYRGLFALPQTEYIRDGASSVVGFGCTYNYAYYDGFFELYRASPFSTGVTWLTQPGTIGSALWRGTATIGTTYEVTVDGSADYFILKGADEAWYSPLTNKAAFAGFHTLTYERTFEKFGQTAGRCFAQSNTLESVLLRSPLYSSVDLRTGDDLQVSFTAKTTSPFTVYLFSGSQVVSQFELVQQDNTDFGLQFRQFTLATPVHFDRIEVHGLIDGSQKESIILHSIKIIRPSNNIGGLWYLGQANSPAQYAGQKLITYDWIPVVDDTYVTQSDPFATYGSQEYLSVKGGNSPSFTIIERPDSPYLMMGASGWLRVWNEYDTSGLVFAYPGLAFNEADLAWAEVSTLSGFAGNASILPYGKATIIPVDPTCPAYVLVANSSYTSGAAFYSSEPAGPWQPSSNPLLLTTSPSPYQPNFAAEVQKYWQGDGVIFMQSDLTETLALWSQPFKPLPLTSDDWIYLRFADTTTSAVNLRLYSGGILQGTFEIATAGEVTDDLHWRRIKIPQGMMVNQLAVVADLHAGEYVMVDEISLERPTIYQFNETTVGGIYDQTVSWDDFGNYNPVFISEFSAGFGGWVFSGVAEPAFVEQKFITDGDACDSWHTDGSIDYRRHAFIAMNVPGSPRALWRTYFTIPEASFIDPKVSADIYWNHASTEQPLNQMALKVSPALGTFTESLLSWNNQPGYDADSIAWQLTGNDILTTLPRDGWFAIPNLHSGQTYCLYMDGPVTEDCYVIGDGDEGLYGGCPPVAEYHYNKLGTTAKDQALLLQTNVAEQLKISHSASISLPRGGRVRARVKSTVSEGMAIKFHLAGGEILTWNMLVSSVRDWTEFTFAFLPQTTIVGIDIIGDFEVGQIYLMQYLVIEEDFEDPIRHVIQILDGHEEVYGLPSFGSTQYIFNAAQSEGYIEFWVHGGGNCSINLGGAGVTAISFGMQNNHWWAMNGTRLSGARLSYSEFISFGAWTHVRVDWSCLEGTYEITFNNESACRIWNCGMLTTITTISIIGFSFGRGNEWGLDAPSCCWHCGPTGTAYTLGENYGEIIRPALGNSAYVAPGHWREYYINIPRESAILAGSYAFNTSVWNSVNSELLGAAMYNYEVPAFYDTLFYSHGTLHYFPAELGDTFTYTFDLQNQGNIGQTYEINTDGLHNCATAAFSIDGIPCDGTPIYCGLANGEGTAITLTLLDAEPVQCNFSVVVTSLTSGSSYAIQASYFINRPPSITSTGDITYEQGTTGHTLSWKVSDTSPVPRKQNWYGIYTNSTTTSPYQYQDQYWATYTFDGCGGELPDGWCMDYIEDMSDWRHPMATGASAGSLWVPGWFEDEYYNAWCPFGDRLSGTVEWWNYPNYGIMEAGLFRDGVPIATVTGGDLDGWGIDTSVNGISMGGYYEVMSITFDATTNSFSITAWSINEPAIYTVSWTRSNIPFANNLVPNEFRVRIKGCMTWNGVQYAGDGGIDNVGFSWDPHYCVGDYIHTRLVQAGQFNPAGEVIEYNVDGLMPDPVKGFADYKFVFSTTDRWLNTITGIPEPLVFDFRNVRVLTPEPVVLPISGDIAYEFGTLDHFLGWQVLDAGTSTPTYEVWREGAELQGHYEGTESFKDVLAGDIPVGWSRDDPSNVGVVDELAGHYKCLQLIANDGINTHSATTTFPVQSSGTIEWYQYWDSAGSIDVNFGDANGLLASITTSTWNGNIHIYTPTGNWGGGSWYPIPTLNAWHRFRFNFNAFTGDFSFTSYSYGCLGWNYWNGQPYGVGNSFTWTGNFGPQSAGVSYIQFGTNPDMYGRPSHWEVDSIGLSWDPLYEVGDLVNLEHEMISVTTGIWMSGDIIQVSVDGLDVGTHKCTFAAFDGNGYASSKSASVTVFDVAPELIAEPDDLAFLAGNLTLSIEWTPSDASTLGATYHISEEGVGEVASGTWTSGTPIVWNPSGLPVGEHHILLELNDGLGGILQDEVIVWANDQVTFAGTPLDFSYSIGESDFTVQWAVSDLLGMNPTYDVFIRGFEGKTGLGDPFITGGVWTSGTTTVILVNFGGMPLGLYLASMVISDGLGTQATDQVVFFVTPEGMEPLDWLEAELVPAGTDVSCGTSSGDVIVDVTFDTSEDTQMAIGIWDTPPQPEGPDFATEGTYFTVDAEHEDAVTFPIYVEITLPGGFPAGMTKSDVAAWLRMLIFDEVSETWVDPQFPIVDIDMEAGTATFEVWHLSTFALGFANGLPPKVDGPGSLSYEYNALGPLVISWRLADLTVGPNPTYAIFREGLLLTQGSWSFGTELAIDASGLMVGTYNYEIIAFDDLGGATTYRVPVVVYNVVPAISSPADLTYEAGSTGNTITWMPADISTSNPTYTIIIDTIQAGTGSWVSGSPIMTCVDGLMPGSHVVKCTLVDGLGLSVVDETLVVVTNMEPVITPPPMITYENGDPRSVALWFIEDSSVLAGTYDLLRDGILVTSGTWASGIPVGVNVGGLAPGSYVYRLIARDGYGAVNDALATVIVLPDDDTEVSIANLNATAMPFNVTVTFNDADPSSIASVDWVRLNGTAIDNYSVRVIDSQWVVMFDYAFPQDGTYNIELQIRDADADRPNDHASRIFAIGVNVTGCDPVKTLMEGVLTQIDQLQAGIARVDCWVWRELLAFFAGRAESSMTKALDLYLAGDVPAATVRVWVAQCAVHVDDILMQVGDLIGAIDPDLSLELRGQATIIQSYLQTILLMLVGAG